MSGLRRFLEQHWARLLLVGYMAFLLFVVLYVSETASPSGAAHAYPHTAASAKAGAGASLSPAPGARSRVRALICDVFGRRCWAALRVVSCETGGTLNPRALGQDGERGLFQIHPVHFGWLDERRLFEPRYNSLAAWRLSRGGIDWSPWSCRP